MNTTVKNGKKYCYKCRKTFLLNEHFTKFTTHSGRADYYICKIYLESVKDTPKFKGEPTKFCYFCKKRYGISHFNKVETKNGFTIMMCEVNMQNRASKDKNRQCGKCKKTFPIKDHFLQFKKENGKIMYVCKHSEKLIEKLKKKEKYGDFKSTKRKKHNNLKKKYGIGLDDYNKMFEDQKGCCAICGIHQSKTFKSLSVDHCHQTGKVRELLCNSCNTSIGLFKENIEILELAIKYLNKHKNN